MAAHADLATRLRAAGVEAEMYTGAPPKLMQELAANVRRGRWPVAVNVKGQRADDCLIVLPLAGYEAMIKDASGGFDALLQDVSTGFDALLAEIAGDNS